MKRLLILVALITCYVSFSAMAQTESHLRVFSNGDAGEWHVSTEQIDSIKYVTSTIEVDENTTDKKYIITYLDNEGAVIKEDTLEYGAMPNFTPEKIVRGNYDITLKYWIPAVTSVKSDATYTAVYDSVSNITTVVFLDYAGAIIGKQFLEPDSSIKYPTEIPIKESDLEKGYDYKHRKWETTKSSDGKSQICQSILSYSLHKYATILKVDTDTFLVSKEDKNYNPPLYIIYDSIQGNWTKLNKWSKNTTLMTQDTIIFTATREKISSSLTEGIIEYPFPINDSTVIYFSKGNLQYNAGDGNTHKTADSTAQGTWRFAERQYDYFGEENIGKDSTYNGWVDLFEWGSSGWEGTHDHDGYVALDTAQCRNADWGVYNAISNGGNEPGLWRTLSSFEWAYLLNRSDWAFAKIGKDSALCLVIFPSAFVVPDTMNIVYASTPYNHNFYESYSGNYYIGAVDSKYYENAFSEEEFEELEARGAIALPCAGHIGGFSNNEFNEYGNIWTSIHNEMGAATELYFGKKFGSGNVDTDVKKSVRLVHVVECKR